MKKAKSLIHPCNSVRLFRVRPRLLLPFIGLAVACGSPPPTYDVVVANGRVMDPESGLDAI